MAAGFLAPALCYLLGSLSFPGIYAKLAGVDLRKKGYGHLGASSIYRATGSAFLFLLLGILDALKGFVAYFFFGSQGLLFAMAGHMFPVFFKFRGGNAVSVYYGGSFAVSPAITLLAAFTELITAYTVKSFVRHILYLLIRALPAVLFPQLLPAYGLLLVRHIWFYLGKLRHRNPL